MNRLNALVICGVLTVSVVVPSPQVHGGETKLQAKSPKLVLTSQINGLKTGDEFHCSDTIHGYITLPTPIEGAHQLEADWVSPNQSIYEHASAKLDFPAPGRRTAYVWARLSGSDGGLMSIREDDSNDASLAGQWTIVVRLDQKVVIEKPFKLRC